MAKLLYLSLITITVLTLSVQESTAAQSSDPGDRIDNMVNGKEKVLPRQPRIESDAIKSRSRLPENSILNKARHDLKTSMPTEEHQKRIRSMYGRQPHEFHSTVRQARNLPAIKANSNSELSQAVSGKQPSRVIYKVVGIIITIAVIVLIIALKLRPRGAEQERKYVRATNEPTDLDAQIKILEDYLRQNKTR